MPFYPPNYRFQPLEALSLCARIVDARAPHDDTLVLNARLLDFADEPIWVRLTVNNQDDPPGIHLHFDTAKESVCKEEANPSTFDEITSHVAPYFGKTVQCTVRARFVIDPDELPQHNLVRLLLRFSRGDDRDRLWLSGATFRIKSDMEFVISWRLEDRSDGQRIVTDIDWQDEMKLDDKYLITNSVQAQKVFASVICEDVEKASRVEPVTK